MAGLDSYGRWVILRREKSFVWLLLATLLARVCFVFFVVVFFSVMNLQEYFTMCLKKKKKKPDSGKAERLNSAEKNVAKKAFFFFSELTHTSHTSAEQEHPPHGSPFPTDAHIHPKQSPNACFYTPIQLKRPTAMTHRRL